MSALGQRYNWDERQELNERFRAAIANPPRRVMVRERGEDVIDPMKLFNYLTTHTTKRRPVPILTVNGKTAYKGDFAGILWQSVDRGECRFTDRRVSDGRKFLKPNKDALKRFDPA